MSDPVSQSDLLRAFLADRAATCPKCNCDLRAVTTDSCPECGQRLELTLGGDAFYHKWRPLLMIAMAVTGLWGLDSVWSQFVQLSSNQVWSAGWIAWRFYWSFVEEAGFTAAILLALHWTWRIRNLPPPRGGLNPYVMFLGLYVSRYALWIVRYGVEWAITLF